MHCDRCGQCLSQGWNFCPHCGAWVNAYATKVYLMDCRGFTVEEEK